MKGFVFDETKRALLWFRSVLGALAQWLFGVIIRMMLVLTVIFFLGGGYSLLKSHLGGKEETELSNLPVQSQEGEGRQTSEMRYPQQTGFGGSEELESRLRSGQSQVRSWEYRLRSLKRDFERFFGRR